MIKKLQRKFIVITMGSLLLIMIIMVGLINGINLYQLEKDTNNKLTFIIDSQGRIPEFKKDDNHMGFRDFPDNPETPYAIRYFVVWTDSEDGIGQTDTGHIKAVTSTDAQNYAKQVIANKQNSGYIGGVYKYMVVEQDTGSMIVFLDCRDAIQTVYRILGISGMVSLATLILMFILVSVFSRRAIKPIIESTEKQKLFITDAGHEIKTPLAIISANADVLELTGGENEWITSIRNQTVRLDKLVKNLLILAKMDEDNRKLTFQEFNYSETVEKIASSFAPVAETQNKKYTISVQPGIKLLGDESSMEQLVSTLIDNAMKYSNELGTIRVSLSTSKKGTKLEVFNTTETIDTENLDRLFDRFYRADSSRARETGGYGIGLSIAKSIVETHHGKISVKSDDGKSICFTAVI